MLDPHNSIQSSTRSETARADSIRRGGSNHRASAACNIQQSYRNPYNDRCEEDYSLQRGLAVLLLTRAERDARKITNVGTPESERLC
eukprot:76339-Pleurochrysis_carterae.AAC.10